MTATKHSATCTMSFGRKDSTCPRCIELINGSPARTWHGMESTKLGAMRHYNDIMRTREIREHYNSAKHRSGGCGVVCTFGDW